MAFSLAVLLAVTSPLWRPRLFPRDERHVPGTLWLPAPLRIVDPNFDRAERLARELRAAGFGVETYAPSALGDPEVALNGGPVWITSEGARFVQSADIERLMAAGSYVLLDGVHPLTIEVMRLETDGRTFGSVRKGGRRFDLDKKATVAIPKRKGRSLASTEHKTPALFQSGKLLWSLPDLTRGLGPLRLTFLPQLLHERWKLQPRVERTDLELYVDTDADPTRSPVSLARNWKRQGVSRVYVAAWKVIERSKYTYDYRKLVAAAHSQGIDVYAWIEWPQISMDFWRGRDECREITATGVPAKIAWRELVAVEVEECYEAAWEVTRKVLQSAPFDGVNVADLYFESPYFGPRAPELYTPFHPKVRVGFERQHGFDPLELLDEKSPVFWKRNSRALALWQKHRSDLLVGVYRRLLEDIRSLDQGRRLVVTLIDDSSDSLIGPLVRANGGQVSGRIMAMRSETNFELQLRDPFPFRVVDTNARVATYESKVAGPFGVGVNVIDQNPKRSRLEAVPTGLEFFRQVSSVSRTGSRVALHGPGALAGPDLEWARFAAAGSTVDVREIGDRIETKSKHPFRLHLGAKPRRVELDGEKVSSKQLLDVPAGEHVIELS